MFNVKTAKLSRRNRVYGKMFQVSKYFIEYDNSCNRVHPVRQRPVIDNSTVPLYSCSIFPCLQ